LKFLPEIHFEKTGKEGIGILDGGAALKREGLELGWR
jgi:hypothetical protein